MSQPCLSKPNQCPAAGPFNELARSQLVRGSVLLNSEGNAASNTMTTTMTSAIQNTGLRRRSRQASAERLAMADPWIEQCVQQVHHEIGNEVDQDQQAHHGDHARSVFQLYALEQQVTDAGNVEDALGDDGAAH